EVLKIPAWLEPLARNAAAPTSNEELIEREKTRRLAEQPKVEETAGETVAGIELEADHLAQLPLQTLDGPLPADDESGLEESSITSNRGILIAADAAGALPLPRTIRNARRIQQTAARARRVRRRLSRLRSR